MPSFKALYYPSWNPPVKWLRSQLLFFDQIQVIRPREVRDPRYDPKNAAVFDLIPDAFGEIRRKQYQMTFSPPNRKLLVKVLDLIAARRQSRKTKELTIELDTCGGISPPGFRRSASTRIERL